MRSKYIFLDIDGVINTDENTQHHITNGYSTSSHRIRLPKETIYQLKRVVSSTRAKIIISSNWRKDFVALNNLRNQFNRYGLSFCGIIPTFDCDSARGRECKWYIDQIYETERRYPNYIIIDDQICDLLPFHKGHIIQTDPQYGLTEKLANIAINILNK